MTAASRVGDVLASKYRLEALLGSGGMGHVYEAVNEDVGRRVAIKVLRSEHSSNAAIVERFLREARAANLVRHPNVVDVLDIGRDSDGSPFIVQELLKGEDLSKYVERKGGKLALVEIEDIFLPVIDAVAEAHAHGVVHRDIKPENVFLAEHGATRVPKLLDFGISKIRLPNMRATEVGVMMGTPAYMAPEQIQHSHETDARCDVWALGIMLFELLAGRLPFDADDAPQLFVAIATKDAPRLIDVVPSVMKDVSRVCERCLRRNPDERYPSALELARDLRHVLLDEEIEPTQRHSLRPIMQSAQGGPELVIPDLALPPKGLGSSAPPTVPFASGANRTEVLPSRPSSARAQPSPSSPDELLPPPAPPRQKSAPELQVPRRPAPASSPQASSPKPPPPQISSGPPRASDPEMAGFMLSVEPSRRPATPRVEVGVHRVAERPAAPDMTFLVGLAVVGLTAIGATAVLMSFLHQPEGLAVVAYVTKPTAILNLAVQGGGALVAFAMSVRVGVAGLKKWRGHVEGGRGSAIVSAAIAGTLFFLAMELARAAF